MSITMDLPGNDLGMGGRYGMNVQKEYKKNKEKINMLPVSTTSGITINLFLTNNQSETTSLNIRSFSYEYNQLLDNLPWAADFFATASELTNVKSLLPYYKEINSLVTNKKFEMCDDFLRQIRTGDLSDVLLVGLLRLTSSWKSELPSWSGLLAQSRKEIKKRGNDSDMLLKGLV